MKMESLTNAKNQLSRLIERVRKGERVRILVNGIPVADLVPVGECDATPSSDALGLASLEKESAVSGAALKFLTVYLGVLRVPDLRRATVAYNHYPNWSSLLFIYISASVVRLTIFLATKSELKPSPPGQYAPSPLAP